MIRRLSSILTLSILVALPVAAQAPRVPPTNDNLAGAAFAAAPGSLVLLNVGEATLETGEAMPPCVASADDSVWFRIHAPSGVTLTVDTDGSTYDTVAAVWSTGGIEADHAALINLDCEDDGAGQAVLTYAVPEAGEYYVSVSSHGGLGGATLFLTFNMKVPKSRLPKGRSPDKPVVLKPNGTVKVGSVQYGMNNFADAEAPSCAPSADDYSTWFRLDVPYNTILTVSSEGSLVNFLNGPSSLTAVTVYPTGTYTQAAEEGCGFINGANFAGVVSSIGLEPGNWIVRVSIGAATNLTDASRYKVRVRFREFVNMTTNHNFEAIDPLDGWVVKNGSGDGIVTGGEAISGAHSFKFVGGPGEKSQLKQTRTPFVPFPIDEDMLFNVQMASATNISGAPILVTLTLFYSDGTKEIFKHKTVTSLTSDPAFSLTPTGKHTVVRTQQSFKFSSVVPVAFLFIDNFAVTMVSLVPRGVLPPP